MKRKKIYHLLMNEVRPAPKEASHYINLEVLNSDLSIKRLTILFNPEDNWDESDYGIISVRNDGMFIADELLTMSRASEALAYKYEIIQRSNQQILHKSSVRYFQTKKA